MYHVKKCQRHILCNALLALLLCTLVLLQNTSTKVAHAKEVQLPTPPKCSTKNQIDPRYLPQPQPNSILMPYFGGGTLPDITVPEIPGMLAPISSKASGCDNSENGQPYCQSAASFQLFTQRGLQENIHPTLFYVEQGVRCYRYNLQLGRTLNYLAKSIEITVEIKHDNAVVKYIQQRCGAATACTYLQKPDLASQFSGALFSSGTFQIVTTGSAISYDDQPIRFMGENPLTVSFTIPGVTAEVPQDNSPIASQQLTEDNELVSSVGAGSEDEFPGLQLANDPDPSQTIQAFDVDGLSCENIDPSMCATT